MRYKKFLFSHDASLNHSNLCVCSFNAFDVSFFLFHRLCDDVTALGWWRRGAQCGSKHRRRFGALKVRRCSLLLLFGITRQVSASGAQQLWWRDVRDGTQRIVAAEFSISFANCYTFKLASLGNNNSDKRVLQMMIEASGTLWQSRRPDLGFDCGSEWCWFWANWLDQRISLNVNNIETVAFIHGGHEECKDPTFILLVIRVHVCQSVKPRELV